MKLPRELDGRTLAQLLARYGYRVSRQSGSHMRLTTTINGEHHITIPDHQYLKVGTLSGILADVASHLNKDKSHIVSELF